MCSHGHSTHSRGSASSVLQFDQRQARKAAAPDTRGAEASHPHSQRELRRRHAGEPAGRLVVHRPLRLLRRRRRLLPDVLLPVRYLRADRRDRRPGSHIVLCERDAVHGAGHGDGLRLPLLLLLPLQAAGAVRAQGEALRRLLRPLVLRGLRPLPGVP